MIWCSDLVAGLVVDWTGMGEMRYEICRSLKGMKRARFLGGGRPQTPGVRGESPGKRLDETEQLTVAALRRCLHLPDSMYQDR